MRGIVARFNSKRGWGFIDGEDGNNYFVHHSGIIGSGFRSLTPGEEVEFDFITVPKGFQAVAVIRESRKQAMSLACQVLNEFRTLPEQVDSIYSSDAPCSIKEEAVSILRGA